MANLEELESTTGVDVEADVNGESIANRESTHLDSQVRPWSNSFMCAVKIVIFILVGLIDSFNNGGLNHWVSNVFL